MVAGAAHKHCIVFFAIVQFILSDGGGPGDGSARRPPSDAAALDGQHTGQLRRHWKTHGSMEGKKKGRGSAFWCQW